MSLVFSSVATLNDEQTNNFLNKMIKERNNDLLYWREFNHAQDEGRPMNSIMNRPYNRRFLKFYEQLNYILKFHFMKFERLQEIQPQNMPVLRSKFQPEIYYDTVEHWHYLKMYYNLSLDEVEADIAEHGQTHYKTYTDIFKIKSFFK
jgi:hypothetical protein